MSTFRDSKDGFSLSCLPTPGGGKNRTVLISYIVEIKEQGPQTSFSIGSELGNQEEKHFSCSTGQAYDYYCFTLPGDDRNRDISTKDALTQRNQNMVLESLFSRGK